MTPLDLYKLLPQKNCGKCESSSCMSFAVQYLRRMVRIHECVELDEEARMRIESLTEGPGDWKERRLASLMEEAKGFDLQIIAEAVGGVMKAETLALSYMGREIKFGRGAFDPALDTMSALLMLMYLRKAGRGPVTGKWVAFRELKDGIIRSETFRAACEEQIAGMFQRNPEGVLSALKGMGAERVDGFTADHSLKVNVLPNIHFLVLLRPPDDEFGADCRILLDAAATEFLDIEALLYLGIAFTGAVRGWR